MILENSSIVAVRPISLVVTYLACSELDLKEAVILTTRTFEHGTESNIQSSLCNRQKDA